MNSGHHTYVFLICLWPLAFLLIWGIWNMVRDTESERLGLRSLDWPETKGKS